MSNDVNVQNTLWRPAFLRLTAVGMPPLGERTCFIEADRILYVRRVALNGDAALEATEIHLGGALAMYVTEQPETVAMMRDRALGHEQKPRVA